jgi:hypothetical protein
MKASQYNHMKRTLLENRMYITIQLAASFGLYTHILPLKIDILLKVKKKILDVAYPNFLMVSKQ